MYKALPLCNCACICGDHSVCLYMALNASACAAGYSPVRVRSRGLMTAGACADEHSRVKVSGAQRVCDAGSQQGEGGGGNLRSAIPSAGHKMEIGRVVVSGLERLSVHIAEERPLVVKRWTGCTVSSNPSIWRHLVDKKQ